MSEHRDQREKDCIAACNDCATTACAEACRKMPA